MAATTEAAMVRTPSQPLMAHARRSWISTWGAEWPSDVMSGSWGVWTDWCMVLPERVLIKVISNRYHFQCAVQGPLIDPCEGTPGYCRTGEQPVDDKEHAMAGNAGL